MSCYGLQPDEVEYKVYEFSFPVEERESCRNLFEKLRNESKNVIYVDLTDHKITVIVTLLVNQQHLIEYANKHQLQIQPISEKTLSKQELYETLLKASEGAKRVISKGSFDRLPAAKQEHIIAHPERYVIKE